jgi:hypothetical protein
VRAFRMVSANVFMVPIKRRFGPFPGEAGTTRINYFDVDYRDAVPGCHVPVSGWVAVVTDAVRQHQRGRVEVMGRVDLPPVGYRTIFLHGFSVPPSVRRCQRHTCCQQFCRVPASELTCAAKNQRRINAGTG